MSIIGKRQELHALKVQRRCRSESDAVALELAADDPVDIGIEQNPPSRATVNLPAVRANRWIERNDFGSIV
jgi:hypothetical protein